jgi:periplasmic divalent cation tolerance protein
MPTVYVTAPAAEAGEIAETVVEERLAACVNWTDVNSVFRWNGDVVREDNEVLLFAKTTDESYDDLVARITALHPYDVPCIERFDEDGALAAFTSWRDTAVDD